LEHFSEKQVNLENKRDPVLVFLPTALHTATRPFTPPQKRHGRHNRVQACVTLRVVASSRGPSRVQAALGRCERARPHSSSVAAYSSMDDSADRLAGNFFFQRWACGQRKRLKWRQAARAASSPGRCSGAALAPSHLGCQRAFHGRCARPRYFPFVHGMRAHSRLSGQALRCM
jgi:hypothetical protein